MVINHEQSFSLFPVFKRHNLKEDGNHSQKEIKPTRRINIESHYFVAFQAFYGAISDYVYKFATSKCKIVVSITKFA